MAFEGRLQPKLYHDSMGTSGAELTSGCSENVWHRHLGQGSRLNPVHSKPHEPHIVWMGTQHHLLHSIDPCLLNQITCSCGYSRCSEPKTRLFSHRVYIQIFSNVQ